MLPCTVSLSRAELTNHPRAMDKIGYILVFLKQHRAYYFIDVSRAERFGGGFLLLLVERSVWIKPGTEWTKSGIDHCLEKNLTASTPSEHPPVRGGEMSKR